MLIIELMANKAIDLARKQNKTKQKSHIQKNVYKARSIRLRNAQYSQVANRRGLINEGGGEIFSKFNNR